MKTLFRRVRLWWLRRECRRLEARVDVLREIVRMRRLLLTLFFCLTPLFSGWASIPRAKAEPHRIVNERGEVEVWTWTHDYRGHPKVIIRNLITGVVRIFVF